MVEKIADLKKQDEDKTPLYKLNIISPKLKISHKQPFLVTETEFNTFNILCNGCLCCFNCLCFFITISIIM